MFLWVRAVNLLFRGDRGNPSRLTPTPTRYKGQHMISARMRTIVAALALGVAGVVGVPGLFQGSPSAPGIAPAAAAGAAVTPKTEAPNEARALSRAFSNVAKALGPSVVRIEVEVARGGMGGGRNRPQPPGGDDDDNNVPPFFRHFF